MAFDSELVPRKSEIILFVGRCFQQLSSNVNFVPVHWLNVEMRSVIVVCRSQVVVSVQ